MKARSIDEAPGGADWAEVAAALEARGYATVPGLLAPAECRALRRLYDDEAAFRSRVVMARHGFGRGEYKYLRYPLPPAVERLRQAIYPRLAPIANRWREALGEEGRFPAALDDYLAACHAAGQTRPTPLILKYGADDYNCLHQDLYGALVFPLQLTVLLSPPGDFAGGEFLLVEQRPRMQSKAEVVPLEEGGAVIFAVHHRPVNGTRGVYRVNQRHGVSRVLSGERYTLGVIFHDAA
ncbi:MAG TPA: 2OG-Fe(II) oxygenase [Stellaceae bacterium]|nr:2OG-Fe(II) oxygenase [Stellaceae bacterium]